MGSCPCFGSRKGKKLKSSDYRDLKRQCQSPQHPSSTNPNDGLSSSDQKDVSTVPLSPQIFTYRELATATNNFRVDSFVGRGGFGSVYKGKIGSTGQVVAVKQLNPGGVQGNKEFLVEVLMLSLLKHSNLVSMIGYCAEGDQRLLVYEYMPLGSLETHLHDLKPDDKPLDWNTRMMIASAAAKGLNYLHNETDPPVIYRDLKSSNILLGEGFYPKLSDFGLAKFGPSGDKSHVSTRVMGTHGYCAPEYALTGKLTLKSDIFSFGIFLFELITGRRPVHKSPDGLGTVYLLTWVRSMLKDRKSFSQLADPNLRGQFSSWVLSKAVELAFLCVQEDANNRPSMNDVVHAMNFFTSYTYDSNKYPGTSSSGHKSKNERSRSSNRGAFRFEKELRYSGQYGSKFEHSGHEKDGSPRETTRMLKNEESDRDLAVAEAKMWGETWRDKRRRSTETTDSDPVKEVVCD